MKKHLVSIALLLVVLCGCAADQESLGNDETQENQAVNSQEIREEEPDQNGDPTFEEANILTIEPADKTDDFWDYWKVTNNGDKLLSDVRIDVAYYDSEGTIIDDSTVGSDAGLQPGKAVLVRSACIDDYTEKEVYGYYYEYPNVNFGDIFRIDINFLTKEVVSYRND